MRRTALCLPLLTVAFPALMLWGKPTAPVPVMPWAVEVYRAYCPALVAEAHIEGCWTGYVDEELHIVVVTATPALVPAELDTIPTLTMAPPPAPPTASGSDPSESSAPGPGPALSGQESPEESASGTEEPEEGAGTSPPSTETQPSASIAGIPYATAVDIFRRQNFMTLTGVVAVGLGANGIVVTTDQPDLIPSTFEGLPVWTEPVTATPYLDGDDGVRS